MCGISGFNFPDRKRIEGMNRAIKHRGPDDEGTFVDESVSLGHVRLSVLDLTRAGRQPMVYEHNGRSAMVVFDGEIYNSPDIRRKLAANGYKFRSGTDAEVVPASYFEWGYDCVNQFNGMWAFAVYDPDKGVLFCSRDRLGRKPLYYYFDESRFIFSSELKGILTHESLRLNRKERISKDALELYFGLGFVPAPFTIYRDAFKLEGRQNLVYDLARREVKKWYYYRIPRYAPVRDKKKLIEEGRGLLTDAVRLRMPADVPVGALLSGGLDSSTTVALMRSVRYDRDLHTFSIGFEREYDETHFIDIVKERVGTNHHHEYFTEGDFENLLETYSLMFDEPFGDPGGFPAYKVCKNAKDYVTVVLSGDGGDEVFGGYPEYVMGYRMDLLRKIPRLLRYALSKLPARKDLNRYSSPFLLKMAFKLSLYDPAFFYAKALEDDTPRSEICRKWTMEKLGSCIQESGGNLAEGLRLYDVLFNTFADNGLTKVDRTAMANGLEVRSPFLDHRLVEFSQKIPIDWKVDMFRTKKLMREIIRGILPDEIVSRKKQGFVPPVREWIMSPRHRAFLEDCTDALADLSPEMHTFFKERVVEANNKLYRRYRVRLFLFGLWMKRWIA